MNSRPIQDESILKKFIQNNKELRSTKSSGSVWGIGHNDRVFCWNGSSWDEPNPQARLRWVECASYGGAVWGVGDDLRVYKWNGNSWDEPNPMASLYNISAFTDMCAVGIGDEGVLFITLDGGQSWSRLTEIKNVYLVSVGNFTSNFIWGIDSGTWRPFYLNPNDLTWEYFDLSFSAIRISAMFPCCGAWIIKGGDNSWGIHKTIDGGNTWVEPNPKAGLHMISAGSDDLTAWGKGYNNRVFKTTNGGESWSEPNPKAGLRHVSFGG